MNKLIAAFLVAPMLSLAPAIGSAAGGHVALQDANIDLTDQASLQSGAKYFVNYCMGCHSLKYMRYNRMAQDLGIDEATLRANLLFGDAGPGDLMTNAMRPEDGEKWFGTAVPDLTLVTRWRSPDWLYTFLKSFYTDPTRPYGVNNLVFPAVGMPHVLAERQGIQEPILEEHHNGGGAPVVTGVKLTQPGSMSAEEYDGMVRDLTNFLTYVGEPMQLERKRLGIYVLLFLGLFFIVAYALKKEYWKDVH
jgi:ubiquinol-cytochrome c reductase cytochrome c1 subunit